MKRHALWVVLAIACSKSPAPISPKAKTILAEPSDASKPGPLSLAYGGAATRIIDHAMRDEQGWQRLEHLTDRIGNRLSGSTELEKAIEWAAIEMEVSGLENIKKEKVMVPHWVRGKESATLLTPSRHKLSMLGLGGSIGTPKKGLSTEIVVVHNFDELDALGNTIRGKAVLFNAAMPKWSEEHGSGYGDHYMYRVHGPSKAAAYGAAFALTRSLTATSLRSPHTGSLYYDPELPQIPAAAISIEDADLIARLSQTNEQPLTVQLNMEAKNLPDAPSYNVMAELKGSEAPEEIVLLGAHIDSWDVGTGAHDDGGGCIAMLQAVSMLKALGLRPKRTIRVVLFTNEENGLRGAKQYAIDHKNEIPNHVMAMESDTGVFAPTGIAVENSPLGLEQLGDIVQLLKPLGANKAIKRFSGADVGPLVRSGVPGLGLMVHGERYFDIHHTEADTLDKVDPDEFRRNVAVAAIIAYVIADMPGRFGPGVVPEPKH